MTSRSYEAVLRRLTDDDPSLTKVRVVGLQNDEDVRKLAAALAKNTTVTDLFLVEAGISPEGSGMLADAITKCSTIKKVFISCNQIGNEGAKSFSAALAHKDCSLRGLYLSRNGIGSVGLHCLATGLVDNSSLQKLDLRSNIIVDGEGVEAINKILASNRSLQWLYLWGNPALSSNDDEHHEKLMNGIRQRCRQTTNTLQGVCVGNPQLQRQIRDYLKWNRLGRHLLSTESNETTPVALWVHYIAKISSERDLIFDLVRAKPDLFKRNVQMRQRRRLQNSVEETVNLANQHDERSTKRRRLE